MAGKELKASEKTVLKHSRDGVVERNLVDSSEKRVSKHTEEAVLKTEAPSDMRFDKLQAAGIAPPEPAKRKFSNLQFGKNNPENKWEEQRVEAQAEMAEQTSNFGFKANSEQTTYSDKNSVLTVTAEEYKESARTVKSAKSDDFSFNEQRNEVQSSEQTSPTHKPRPPEQPTQTTDYKFTRHSSEQFATFEQPLPVTAQEFKESMDFNFKGGQETATSALKDDKPSKLKSKQERNSLQEHSSATEALADKKSDEAFFFEGEAPKPILTKRQFTENSVDVQYTLSDNSVEVTAEELRSAAPSEEYTTSDDTVTVSADEFRNGGEDFDFKNDVPTEERSKDDLSLEKEEKQSKLKEKKERNTLREHSSASEKLTDDDGNSVLYFEGEAPVEGEPTVDKKTRKLEKKLEKAEQKLSKLEQKNDKKLPKLVKKDEKRVYKLEKRIAKAEDKLPQHRVFHVRKEFNPEKQKMQRKLRLEKEAKPLNRGGIVTKGIKKANTAVKTTISGAIHSEISKYEQEDTTLKAAHGTEKVAESALRFTKDSIKAHHQRLKEKPYEKVSKLKFKREATVQKLNEHKALTNNKKLRKDENSARKEVKKAQQKLQRKNAAKQSAKKTASSAGKKTAKAGEKVAETIVKTVANNKVVIIIIVIFLVLFALFGVIGSALLSSVSETGGMVIGSTYTSDDEDIYAANDYMNSLESALVDRLNNIPNEYVGWNEYRWNFDAIGHDPYALTSYLTAMELAFEFDEITRERINELFNALYTLEIVSIHEVRSYQYTEIDENGNEIIVTVYYDYYILEATLTANDWESVVKPRLEFAGVYDLYLLLQENKGNKPDLF